MFSESFNVIIRPLQAVKKPYTAIFWKPEVRPPTGSSTSGSFFSTSITYDPKVSSKKSNGDQRYQKMVPTVFTLLKGIRPIYAASDLYDACKATVDEAFAKKDDLVAELRGQVPLGRD